jgi:beta-lactamase class A
MSIAEVTDRVQALVDRLDGRAGVHVRHLGTGAEISISADDVFPAACIIKVPILMALFQRVADGDLDWNERLTMTEDRVYGLDQVVDRIRPGTEMDLSELVHHMVSLSDVAAGLWCQDLAGGGHAINEWLADRGYMQTRVNSRTRGRESEFADFGWGQTTPREALDLLVGIRERRAVSPEADAYADRILASTYYVQDSIFALPTDVHAILKTGSTDHARSEVLLISTPDGPLGCSVMTDGLADSSWGFDNAGDQFGRDITGLVWDAWGSGSHASRQGTWPPQGVPSVSRGHPA